MTHLHCMRCGEPAAVIDDETSLCGDCFLEAAMLRRRLATPVRRWRAKRERRTQTTPAAAEAAKRLVQAR